tara:strand:+ start:197 stop:541 length:345 start_codon:yes stop_codon:yes gene_type:complete
MFLSSIGRLAQSVGGGLMTAARGAADKVMNPGETISYAIGDSRAARALQNPAKFFDDEMRAIAAKMQNGQPLSQNETAKLQAFQQQAQQNFQNAQAAVQLPTGGFMNSAQQRLM